MAGQGVVGPVLPLYARDFGVSTAIVGLTFTAFGVARLLLNIPAGIWADRGGRRALLIGGPLITAVGMVGSGLAPSIWVLLAWRLVAGAGSALYMTGAQIYLIDIAGEDRRARYIATNQGALLLGVSVGPALGGLLADSFSLRTPFLVVGAGAALTSVYAFFRLPETARHLLPAAKRTGAAGGDGGSGGSGQGADDDQAPVLSGAERWAAQRAFIGTNQFMAVAGVTMAVFAIRSGFRQTLVPLNAADRFGWDTGDLGLLFTMVGVIGLVLIAPAGWAADRFGRRPSIIGPSYVAVAGVALAALAGTPGLFIAGNVIAALGTSISGPAPSAFVADLAPEELRGAAMGLYRTVGDLGLVLAPVLAGALADATSMRIGMLSIAAFMLAAVSWFAMVAREPGRG